MRLYVTHTCSNVFCIHSALYMTRTSLTCYDGMVGHLAADVPGIFFLRILLLC